MKSHPRAVWLDPTAPDLSRILTPGLAIDATEFAAWLAPHLVEYRLLEASHEATASREEGIKALNTFVVTLEKAAELLDPGRLPTWCEALIAGEIGTTMQPFCRDTQERLYLLLDAARKVQVTTPAGEPGAKGRKARDKLLAAVVGRLRETGIKVSVAQDLAREILLACGVPVVADMKRAERRAQK